MKKIQCKFAQSRNIISCTTVGLLNTTMPIKVQKEAKIEQTYENVYFAILKKRLQQNEKQNK